MKNKIADIYDSSAQGIEKKHIPELRFPEFANTGEWEEKTIEDIFRITRGLVLPMKSISLDKDEKNPYPVYSSQTLNNGLAGFYGDYLYENAITWTTDGANAGEVKFRRGKFYCTNVCGVLLSNEGYANECVAAIINSISKKYVSYVGNPKLMNNVMAKITIFLPPTFAEQQKIADCLSSIDEQILATQEKWDSLKEYKRGLMQRLFPANGKTTPDFRFPEFANAGEWETQRLGESYHVQGGYAFKSSDFQTDGIPIIRISNIPIDALCIELEGCVFAHCMQRMEQHTIQEGDLLIAMSGATTGKTAVYHYPQKAYLNQRVGLFVSCAQEKQHYSFLCQWAKSDNFYAQLDKILAAGAQPNISSSDIESMIWQYPKQKEEQQKIAECLSSIDEQILATQQKWELLKEHKRGLMQRLFC